VKRNAARLTACAFVVTIMSVGLALGATTTASAAAPVIRTVTFSGSSASPVVTLHGSFFGAQPPSPSYPPCDAPNNGTGLLFGTAFYFKDKSARWEAGHGGLPGQNTNCIGVIITSWSSRSVSFEFGSDYGGGTWVLNAGDRYTVTLRAVNASGTVTYT
jgi:hypothetical protein